jgi:hypothetical protein
VGVDYLVGARPHELEAILDDAVRCLDATPERVP